LRQPTEEIIVLAENFFSGLLEFGVIRIFHSIIRRRPRAQRFLQKIQNLFLFRDRQAANFFDDFKRTHNLTITVFSPASKMRVLQNHHAILGVSWPAA
jgi:hypothetical protein